MFEAPNSQSVHDDDPLDEFLREASWPDPSPETEARLADKWRSAWSARLRREKLMRRAAALAVAATLLVAAALGWWQGRRAGNGIAPVDQAKLVPPAGVKTLPDSKGMEPLNPPRGTVKTLPKRTVPNINSTSPNDGDALALSRAPTRLEQLLFDAMDGRRRPRAQRQPTPGAAIRRAKRAPTKADDVAVDVAIARLVAEPKADVAKVAAALRPVTAERERRLMAVLQSAPPGAQIAAIRLLGEIGSPAAAFVLLDALSDANLHAAAVAALSRVGDSSTIEELVVRESNVELQRTLLAGLLARGDEPSVASYLKFAENAHTSQTALAAADLVREPPIELLFAALHSTVEPERIAAARVLGRIDGPETTRRLIGMIEQGTSRQEACIALLSSRGDEAVQFVSYARNDPQWRSALQAASLLIPETSQPRS